MKNKNYRDGFLSDPEDMQLQWDFIAYLKEVVRGARADYFATLHTRGEREESLEAREEQHGAAPAETDLYEALLEHMTLRLALSHLSAKERRIIEEIYFKGKTDCETAKEIGVTRQRIQYLRKRALSNLRDYMTEEE